MSRLIKALLLSATFVTPALAADCDAANLQGTAFGVFLPPAPLPPINSPGDFNKLAKTFVGTPGQNNVSLGPVPPGHLPPNEFAQARNDARRIACPN